MNRSQLEKEILADYDRKPYALIIAITGGIILTVAGIIWLITHLIDWLWK